MKDRVVLLILRIIENVLFFTALALMFLLDWKAGLALVLYEISRGCELAREYRQHKSQIFEYIKEVLTDMFRETVKKRNDDKERQ
jgi:hypothetical protein